MSQYLTNIGKTETSGAASIGAVSLNAGTGLIGSAGVFVYNSVSTNQITPLIAGTALIGSANIFGGGGFINIVNTVGLIVNVANTGGAYSLYAGTAMVGSATVVVTNTGGYTFSVINSAGWNVNVSNTGGTFASYQSGVWSVNIINSAGWIVNTANVFVQSIAGSALIGTMNTLAIGAGNSTILTAGTAMVGSATVVLSPGAAIVGTTYTILLPSSASINAGSATIGTAYAILLPSSASINAGVASIGTASVILMNTANWYINVVNTAGITLGASALVAGSIRTLQYAAESVGLVAGLAMVGSVRTMFYGAASVNLTAGVASIGTASVSLMAGTLVAGSIRTLSYGAESCSLVAGSVVAGSIRTLQYAAESVGLVAGVASIGTASVILMNSSAVPKDVVIESMKMTSSGLDIYSYSTGIECSATNNLIVSASVSRIIKVVAYTLMSQIANNARFQSGSNSTTFVTGNMFYGGSGGMVAPYNPMGWFQTTAGSPLYLTLATANSVGGVVSYLVM